LNCDFGYASKYVLRAPSALPVEALPETAARLTSIRAITESVFQTIARIASNFTTFTADHHCRCAALGRPNIFELETAKARSKVERAFS
jgi:hypothetical protein